MITILTLIFLIFGFIIGSFLNVVIYRFNTARSFGGRSACMSCQTELHWSELIPLVSFLIQKGRCLNCQTKISIQYPLVEFITGLIFAALFLKLQALFFASTFLFTVVYTYYALMFSLLIVVAVYDLRHKIIPDLLALVFGVLAFVGLFFFNVDNSLGFYPHWPSVLEFLSGPLIALPLYLFWLVSSGRWMGLGDAKLAVGLGWLLGFSRAISGVVVAFWIGAIVGIALVIFSKQYRMRSEIPFAPYLVSGALLSFLFELHLFGI